MADLVTIDEAAKHLRIDDYTAEQSDLELKISAASEVIIDELDIAEDLYDDQTCPAKIKIAVLLQLGFLHSNRAAGDSSQGNSALLAPEVRAMIFSDKTFEV